MGGNTAHILVVDDDPGMRELLEILLVKEGYEVTCAKGGAEAVALVGRKAFDVVVTDIRMQHVDGLEVLRSVKKINPSTPVVMISAYASAETAVEAMREGAYDYFPKPFDTDLFREVIADIVEAQKSKGKSPQKIEKKASFGHIVGRSSVMLKIYDLVERVSKANTNVLITGESGTGKELIARAIHENSGRKGKNFVTVNCGGIPETLLESELFGYKKGAFTGATIDKKGLLEVASHGTFFLDEVGELSLPMQVKILRVIQDRTFKPLGGVNDIEVDVRFIAATNKDLEKEVIEHRFREDLFFRLNVITIHLPPLRERKEDIPLLAQNFLEKYSRLQRKDILKISSFAMEILRDYQFPGNVRELENIVERSVALERSNIILPESMTLSTFKKAQEHTESVSPVVDLPPEGVDLDRELAKIESEYILKALDRTHGNRKKTADLLRINMRSLRYRLEKLNIKVEGD
jgi:two-component system response regulator PilR (NtrC family)